MILFRVSARQSDTQVLTVRDVEKLGSQAVTGDMGDQTARHFQPQVRINRERLRVQVTSRLC